MNNYLKYVPTPLNIVAGITLSFYLIIMCFSFVEFIFSGPLVKYIGIAIYPLLAGTIVATLILSLFSTLPIAIANTQQGPLPVVALMVLTVVYKITDPAAFFSTAILAIALSTILTGIVFYFIGTLKLGNLVRYIPFPVIIGFMLGVAWLLMIGTLKKMVPQGISYEHLAIFFTWPTLLNLSLTIGFALLLFILDIRIRHPLVFPICLIAGIILFYLGVFYTKIPIETLREKGLLFASFQPTGPFEYLTKSISFKSVDWSIIFDQLGALLTIVMVSIFGLLFTVSNLEHLLDLDLDINKELRTMGIGNLLGGLLGGMVCCHAVFSTVLSNKMHTQGRNVGILCAIFCTLYLFFGMSFGAYIPCNVLLSLLLYYSLSLFKSRYYDLRHKLGTVDHIIIFSILFAVGFVGLLVATIMGVVFAILLFVINDSRISAVKYLLSGKFITSNKKRQTAAAELLFNHGEQVLYIKLQNYLFFGTTYSLVDFLKEYLIKTAPAAQFIILDFEHVFAIDSSASIGFEKLQRFAINKHIRILFTELNQSIWSTLIRTSTIKDEMMVFPTRDSALEWCEEIILTQNNYTHTSTNLEQQLLSFLNDEKDVNNFIQYFDKTTLSKGDYLFHQGDLSKELYFIESGTMAVLLERNRVQHRLATLSTGNPIGEMALFLDTPRSASVKAEDDCILRRLIPENLERMELEHPNLALCLQKKIAQSLAERLEFSDKQVEILLQ